MIKMAEGVLNKAKKQKADEFYTQLFDIEKEAMQYKHHFKGKTILCNCDDPRISQFFYFFYSRFSGLGLKRLIATCYKNLSPDLFTQCLDEQAVYCIYDGKDRYDDVYIDYESFIKENEWGVLKKDGDFRSPECIELLKQSDIVVTNPPFSLFREYIALLMKHEKKFLIIGDQNALAYKEVFQFVKENKIWLGIDNGGTKWFQVPPHYNIQTQSRIKTENGIKYFSKGNIAWYTNLDHRKRHENIVLYKKYNKKEYPKYDNYNAIEVSTYKDIPLDYDGIMGVPITFLDKYNPDQFEIVGNEIDLGIEKGRCYINGKRLYSRIFIKRK
jgi:hypothetical protein